MKRITTFINSMISFEELPDDLKDMYILELFKFVIIAILMIALSIQSKMFIGLALIVNLVLAIIEVIRYIIICSGRLILIEATCTDIRDHINLPLLKKVEKTKDCILQNDAYTYKINLTKRKVRKLYVGMNVKVYIMPSNIYKNMEGIINLSNPMFLTMHI